MKCYWDEVKSYEVVLAGFFIIIILRGCEKRCEKTHYIYCMCV